MKRKSVLCVLMSALMLGGAAGCAKSAPRGEEVEKVDKTKTQIIVYNYDGGVGSEWLERMKTKFEAQYATESFEENKEGVQVRIEKGKDIGLNITSTNYDIIFNESVRINSYAGKGEILPINDVVTSSLSDVTGGKETGTIEDMLFPEFKEGLKALDGNYYALPHYEAYSGITYDKDVFEEYGFYFLEGGGFCDPDAFEDGVYTGSGKLSVGPDGVRGTTDDGQPSSYEEFFAMMDEMVKKKITPFIWSGMYETAYLLKVVEGAWAAWSGYDQMRLAMTFDGNGGETPVLSDTVYSFDSNGNPVVTQETITPETGYKVSAQEGKYYGFKLLEKIMSSSQYSSILVTETLSHLDAQEEYIRSNLENNPVAMFIDGSYWYNEASEALARSENKYKARAKNRRFSMMELPSQATGQVSEGQGRKNTLVSRHNSYAVVNANVKNDPERMEAVKKFLKFCYTEENLIDFTVTSGVYRGMDYSVPETMLTELPPFKQSICRIREKSDVVSTISANKIYINNESGFSFDYSSKVMSSTVKGTEYYTPTTAFEEGISAKDYFLGTYITERSWNINYAKFFN